MLGAMDEASDGWSRPWQDPQAYAFTASLAREQWPWEFLRRNPDYQREWQAFRVTWEALERDYGRPPERDFVAWKADPRAYVQVGRDETADGCRVDEERVLIECALGARWGFYKFPLDPATDRPRVGEQLLWRPVEHGVNDGALQVGPEQEGVLLSLTFDLSRPLRDQLDAARRFLVASQHRLRKSGALMPHSVETLAPYWTRCLRLLDGEAAGASREELAAALFAGEGAALAACRQVALHLRDGGYRQILLLPEREGGK
jgi:hypothetical protein